MKNYLIIVTLLSTFTGAYAQETKNEKAEANSKSVMRESKKDWNSTKEAFCGKLTGDSKTACLAKKAKHRASESGDAIEDKANEVKNKVD